MTTIDLTVVLATVSGFVVGFLCTATFTTNAMYILLPVADRHRGCGMYSIVYKHN